MAPGPDGADREQAVFSQTEARNLLTDLVAAEEFERYLHTRYIGKKRFSVEGGESLIPLLNTLVEEGANQGAEKVIVAMAHRGRLNALAHVMQKPYEVILSEFEETNLPTDSEGDGDVKYHLGYSSSRSLANGKKVKVSAPAQPEPPGADRPDPAGHHPLSAGARTGDKDRTKRRARSRCTATPRFTGQGIVFETLEPVRAARLPHGRDDSHHRQQPGRLYDARRSKAGSRRTRPTWPR